MMRLRLGEGVAPSVDQNMGRLSLANGQTLGQLRLKIKVGVEARARPLALVTPAGCISARNFLVEA